MTVIQYTVKVKDALLLELPAEAEALHLKPGAKVQIQVDLDLEDSVPVQRNESALDTLRILAEMKKDMRETDGSQTDMMIREGRAGAMYNHAAE